jgi:mRNA interferase MazF
MWPLEPATAPTSRAIHGAPVLSNVVVAPITRTIRRIPTCVSVGPDEGLDHDSVATFDKMAAVPKDLLTIRLGSLGRSGRDLNCSAVRGLADC